MEEKNLLKSLQRSGGKASNTCNSLSSTNTCLSKPISFLITFLLSYPNAQLANQKLSVPTVLISTDIKFLT